MKKLIEVALPLEAINKASAREKSIRHGHPSTLHLWWARRPLAAARAVIFAQMVDDPSGYVDTLKSDPKLRRRAESVLKARHKVWAEATGVLEKARQAGIGAPEPGPEPTLDEILAEHERERLFKIIEDLVLWENTTNETVLQAAREEIWQSWRRTCAEHAGHPRAKELFDRHKLPGFHDPFAGGGAIPLEAQRLGLEAYASDLNPVAVLINKAMIEIPPKFAGRPPVNPEWQKKTKEQRAATPWRGAQGLAEDVRYYGKWMRDEAEKRIGHLYPKIEITSEMAKERPDLKPLVGQKLTVIAWLWARTVKSPNPAFRHVDVPLIASFNLANMVGKEAWVEPIIKDGEYSFKVRVGKPIDAEWSKTGTKMARGSFRCLVSNVPIKYEHIDSEANAGRIGARLMAIVAEGERGRVYLSPEPEHAVTAQCAMPSWKPDAPCRGTWASNAQGRRYGFNTFGDYFTPRQLVILKTLSDLAIEALERIRHDAVAAQMADDEISLREEGFGAKAYAEAVQIYLGLAISRFADRNNSLCTWDSGPSGAKSSTGGSARTASLRNLFARQGISMVWDFGEANPFSDSGGGYNSALAWIEPAIRFLSGTTQGFALSENASTQSITANKLVSTDPPYYDNIGYADLSDFFYVWLRRALQPTFPNLFATLAVPKAEELVATPYRHGGKEAAEAFFLAGMTDAMRRVVAQAHPAFPVTIYYAFKQSESETNEGIASTGWETFLEALILAGFSTSGTWPMRTELSNKVSGIGRNMLASSIVLVCRPRPSDAPMATRREFVAVLQRELPQALRHLQAGNIAPVDLAQAAIGPGMAVFTRYAQVLDAQGKALTVREALALINETLDTALAEQEGDFDADSRWALAWFEQFGFDEGEYGVAETLSKAKNTSVSGLAEAGILDSHRGKVRLFKPDELPANWDPATDTRLTNWETVHHLIRVLASGGESAAAELVAKLGAKGEVARELAYRLYTLCERKKRAADALAYNGLVQSWPELMRLAGENAAVAGPEQVQLL
jgi:putative DNA methylase